LAALGPFRGLRFNPELVKLGGVLSPPYDVIDPAAQEALYSRDMRNVVRLELGLDYEDDARGVRDRYTRAREHLESWIALGILECDPEPAFYVSTHSFTTPAGVELTRRGVFGLVPAAPWERSELRPHERTLRAPKEDRLQLLRATRLQVSSVFVVAAGAQGLDERLRTLTTGEGLLGGRTQGELGPEKHVLWRRGSASELEQLRAALATATLYVADGHHRYETAVAYADERRRTEPERPAEAPSYAWCLVHVVPAEDPALTILPTHRLVRPGPGVAHSLDDLWARLDDAFEVEPVADAAAGLARCAALRDERHAFCVIAHDGVAVLHRTRRGGGTARERLDVTVLEEEVLVPAGVGPEAIAGGALTYTRDAGGIAAAVRRGDAVLGFAVNPVSVAEVIAVAEAGETMPQKSTYFYPKVPAGMVMHRM
jgi:uncharacterized protein (DUF1015 family)